MDHSDGVDHGAKCEKKSAIHCKGPGAFLWSLPDSHQYFKLQAGWYGLCWFFMPPRADAHQGMLGANEWILAEILREQMKNNMAIMAVAIDLNLL